MIHRRKAGRAAAAVLAACLLFSACVWNRFGPQAENSRQAASTAAAARPALRR